jgi:activator of HSP90 ATPase
MREHNPNNWYVLEVKAHSDLGRHWTTKNCQAWAKEYFQTNLTQISAEDGPTKVSVKKVSSCEGDVDVSQRKGKIITLFDVKLVLDIEGTTCQLPV